MSDIMELTILSRFPSSVPEYNSYASPRKTRAAVSTEQNKSLQRSPDHGPPSSFGVKGGFGTLDVLSVEIRQEIYGLAFGIDQPVTVKQCCTPDISKRKRANCPKHGTLAKADAGRFNVLQISTAVREEAMYVVFGKGSPILNTENYMSKYFCGWWSKGLRGIVRFKATSARQKPTWNTASQFRMIKVEISEEQLQYGNPYVFVDRLVRTISLLCTEHQKDHHQTASKSVDVDLGSLFHQMLPFNEETKIGDRYGEYLDWLYVHSNIHDPNHDKLAEGVVHSLERLVSVISKYSGSDRWRVLVKTEVPEEEEGGVRALNNFHVGCVRHGVEFCPHEN